MTQNVPSTDKPPSKSTAETVPLPSAAASAQQPSDIPAQTPHADAVGGVAEQAGAAEDPASGEQHPAVTGPSTASLSLSVPRSEKELLIITGMSGAGRSTAAKVLEDLGWYVVDNLPPALIPSLVDFAAHPATNVQRLAVAVDVRGRAFFPTLTAALQELRDRGLGYRLLFLDADDDTLVRRYESVRRPHPLQGEGRLLDGIMRERVVLAELRSMAEIIVDTSHSNVHQLSAKVAHAFGDANLAGLRITVMSFGFKYGLPRDADHVADVRFIPNPFWVPQLRPRTGLDESVRDFVLAAHGGQEFLDSYTKALLPALAGYVRENKRYAMIAIGCTGGKHRSVAMAEALAKQLQEGWDQPTKLKTATVHRDLGRE